MNRLINKRTNKLSFTANYFRALRVILRTYFEDIINSVNYLTELKLSLFSQIWIGLSFKRKTLISCAVFLTKCCAPDLYVLSSGHIRPDTCLPWPSEINYEICHTNKFLQSTVKPMTRTPLARLPSRGRFELVFESRLENSSDKWRTQICSYSLGKIPLSWKYLCVYTLESPQWVHSIYHYFIEERKDIPKISICILTWRYVNPQWLVLLLSRTNFQGSTD